MFIQTHAISCYHFDFNCSQVSPFFSYSFTLLLLPHTTQAKKEGGKKKKETEKKTSGLH